MKILVIGSSSFAAQEVVSRLRGEQHEVWTFDRRRSSNDPHARWGDALRLAAVFGDAPRFDVIVNYLLLKSATVESNLQFCDALAEFVGRSGVGRVIHVSSVTVVDARHAVVNEATPIEEHAGSRPPYSRLKIETERRLRGLLGGVELVMLRPGFILGPGLADPMPGIGRVLPSQHILGIGWRHTTIPMISRRVVDEAVLRLCSLPLPQRETVVQLTDASSPHRGEYLDFCCRGLGLGRGTLHWPRWFWWLGLAAASPLLALKQRKWRFLPRMFAHNLARRRFDASASERFLGVSFHHPWRNLVAEACENQRPNYRVPEPLRPTGSSGVGHAIVLYVGFGRIVRERHLPALAQLGFQGEIEWFDPAAGESGLPAALRLRRLTSLSESRAASAVIATPAFTRAALTRELPSGVRRILFEKPLALSRSDFGELRDALGGREAYALHNYRYKANTQALLAALQATNAGRLIETRLHFDSPAVDHDAAAWMRDERRARTLLMDYGLHFADLAMLLAEGEADWREMRHDCNARGQTTRIQALARFANHDCRLFLRQGARQRRCEIEYVFQNRTARLTFFPDTFAIEMGSRSFLDDVRVAWHGAAATAKKVLEKTRLAAPEPSHRHVLRGFLNPEKHEDIAGLRLEALAPVYRRLLALADGIYGGGI